VVRKTVTVDLGDYDEVYRGATFEVWVTPTRAHVQTWGEIAQWLDQVSKRARVELEKKDTAYRKEIRRLEGESKTAEIQALEKGYKAERAEFDTQTAERLQAEYDRKQLGWLARTWLNVPEEEAREIRDHLVEVDPRGWEWLVHQTHEAIGEYRRSLTKN